MTLRALAGRLAPQSLKDALDRRATGRFLDTVTPLTRAFVERHGLTVLRGPFAGLQLDERMVGVSGDLVAKLLGTYERELRPAFEEWVAAAPRHVVDVGSAEGYYAVGLAHAIPSATVLAYDIDADARARCRELAARNGVEDRVDVREECTPESLGELPAAGVVLLSDCEGCEQALLDPARQPLLRGWPILVELHDFIDASISARLRERFEGSHDIELITEQPVDEREVPELADLHPHERDLLLSENRPTTMSWFCMRPRG
jgi:precorrin-6B methylase 2